MRVILVCLFLFLSLSYVTSHSIRHHRRVGHADAHAQQHALTLKGPSSDKQQQFLNQVLGDIKSCGGSITSDGACSAKFAQYTGVDHATLLKLWKNPKTKRFTTCNGFTGVYLSAMGWPGLGRFDLDKYKLTKKFVYVPNQQGTVRLPAYGDVCFGPNFHVWVSLGQDGVIEGGQGGPAAGRDKVDFKEVNKKDINQVKWCLDVTALMDSRNTL